MKFELRATADGSRARRATLTTLRNTIENVIETPVFMPVGTRGSVRTQTLAQLDRLGASIILANTYHLLVRPGIELFERLGGLHRWMGWTKSVLTDSGGFQIFSLPNARSLGEEGAEFRSYADGTRLLLTPERSIAMQRAIGSDIMMVLDQCIDSTSSHAHATAAMELTHRWAARSLRARGDSAQALFAIVQGACFPDLRRISADVLTGIAGFDGFAIGGLAVGETRAQREDVTELVTSLLPPDRPRYLMGVGTPLDLLEAVHRGVDMFDCVLPTAWAQQGVVFTARGRVDLRRGVHRFSQAPLDATCACEACTLYSRSYLHHLIKCKEPLGWSLLAFHNLSFYARLMAEIRAQLERGTFARFHAEQRSVLALADQDNPPARRPRVRAAKPSTRGAFAVHTSPQGVSTIARVGRDIVHPASDPDARAERIYIAPSAAIARAIASPGSAALVIWDVGLGDARTAMALLRRLEGLDHAPIALTSFERDLDGFRLALDHQKEFAHLRHPGPHILAKAGVYRRERLSWTVCEGDFAATFEAQPRPDVVLYALRSTEVLARLVAYLGEGVELIRDPGVVGPQTR